MEHTRFVGLDIHKERISIAVAESGRSCAVEYLGEISNDPVAIGMRLRFTAACSPTTVSLVRWGGAGTPTTMRRQRAS